MMKPVASSLNLPVGQATRGGGVLATLPEEWQVRVCLCDRHAQSYNTEMDNDAQIEGAAWERLVKNMLRAEMLLRGIPYEQLV